MASCERIPTCLCVLVQQVGPGEMLTVQGSTNIGQSRFRSPQEFIPHAEWLFDTTKPLSDHSQVSYDYGVVADGSAAASITAAASWGRNGRTPMLPAPRNVRRVTDRTRSGRSTTTRWIRLLLSVRRMLGVNDDSVRSYPLATANVQGKESLFGSRSIPSSHPKVARSPRSRTGRDSLRLSPRSRKTTTPPTLRWLLLGLLPGASRPLTSAGTAVHGSTRFVPWACSATATR